MPNCTAAPRPLEPRGLSRVEASAYLGVGASLFDGLVNAGLMPRPKMLRGRRVWDRYALDRAFDDMPDVPSGAPADGKADPWSDVAA